MSGYKKSAHGFPDILRKFSLLPLTVPAVLFVLLFLVLPSALLFSYSIQTQSVAGDIGLPLTLSNYERLFDVPLYFRVLVTTLKISLITAFVTVVIGFPVALVIVRGSPLFGRILTIVIIAPLVLSSVVRTYGWMLVLANTDAGVVNWFLSSIGLGPAALRVLYTQTAVVIGSVHVFLPMMVLPLASSLARINPAVEEAARTLGAPSWRVFLRVTLPLSVPGLVAGFTIVFSLTAASFVVPAILGGSNALMLGNLLQQQVISVYDWPFASAIAVVMVLTTFFSIGVFAKLLDGSLVSSMRRRRAV